MALLWIGLGLGIFYWVFSDEIHRSLGIKINGDRRMITTAHPEQFFGQFDEQRDLYRFQPHE